MCEYCRTTTKYHAMGCPNAPDPEPIERCSRCGADIYEWDEFEDTIDGVFCEKCAEELYGEKEEGEEE